jgi:ribosomal protein S18 acetylase RimI-like enzyme
MTMDYRLRPATEEDEPFLKELSFDLRAPDFLALQMPEAALMQLLEMQYRAQKAGYQQQFPNAESTIVWVGPYRVGRMLVNPGKAALHLIDIALLTAFRGHGIGRSMIESLIERARQAAVPLRLTVREENRAMQLYARLGFVRCGERAMSVEMEWGGAPATPPPAHDSIHESGSIVPGLNGAYFRSVCQTQAIIQKSAGEQIVLKLASVESLRPDRDARVSLGDSFTLTFEGDAGCLLPQGIYELQFEDSHTMEIFIVPIRSAHGIVTYESVFNRMMRMAEAPA